MSFAFNVSNLLSNWDSVRKLSHVSPGEKQKPGEPHPTVTSFRYTYVPCLPDSSTLHKVLLHEELHIATKAHTKYFQLVG